MKGNLLLFEDEKFGTVSTKQEADAVVDKDYKSLLINKDVLLEKTEVSESSLHHDVALGGKGADSDHRMMLSIIANCL